MSRYPVLTLGLCCLALALYAPPEQVQALLYFDRAQLAAGAYHGLASGHWLHFGGDHLVWNIAALALLGSWIETRSRRLLVCALAAGTLAVDLVLLLPPGELQRYCGLSGVLNTLMGVVLWLQWRATRSPIVPAVGLLWAGKIAVETLSGQGIFTSTAWPPFADAHLAGMLATPLAFAMAASRRPGRQPPDLHNRNNNDEYLVQGN